MVPISEAKARAPRQLKPQRKWGTGEAPAKLIRLEPADLKLIERAARSIKPPLSASYFIVQAAVARAKQVLSA